MYNNDYKKLSTSSSYLSSHFAELVFTPKMVTIPFGSFKPFKAADADGIFFVLFQHGTDLESYSLARVNIACVRPTIRFNRSILKLFAKQMSLLSFLQSLMRRWRIDHLEHHACSKCSKQSCSSLFGSYLVNSIHLHLYQTYYD